MDDALDSVGKRVRPRARKRPVYTPPYPSTTESEQKPEFGLDVIPRPPRARSMAPDVSVHLERDALNQRWVVAVTLRSAPPIRLGSHSVALVDGGGVHWTCSIPYELLSVLSSGRATTVAQARELAVELGGA